MLADGKLDTASIRQVSALGGSGDAVRQAYEAARRAIIRCGARGFDLPANKVDQGREIVMERPLAVLSLETSTIILSDINNQ